MRHRKPDILLVLTLSVGLGVLVTGYAQKLLYNEPGLVAEKHVSNEKSSPFDKASGPRNVAVEVGHGNGMTN